MGRTEDRRRQDGVPLVAGAKGCGQRPNDAGVQRNRTSWSWELAIWSHRCWSWVVKWAALCCGLALGWLVDCLNRATKGQVYSWNLERFPRQSVSQGSVEADREEVWFLGFSWWLFNIFNKSPKDIPWNNLQTDSGGALCRLEHLRSSKAVTIPRRGRWWEFPCTAKWCKAYVIVIHWLFIVCPEVKHENYYELLQAGKPINLFCGAPELVASRLFQYDWSLASLPSHTQILYAFYAWDVCLKSPLCKDWDSNGAPLGEDWDDWGECLTDIICCTFFFRRFSM